MAKAQKKSITDEYEIVDHEYDVVVVARRD